jgi:hypothetical protein
MAGFLGDDMKGLASSVVAVFTLLLFWALMIYTPGSCGASSSRIESSEQALRTAERVLLDHFQPHRLTLAPASAFLVSYMKSHPDCCSVSKEYWWSYLDYV